MAHEEIVRRAVELAKAGRKAEARALLEDVLRKDPENIGALSAMARASDTDEEAIAALERVLEVAPDDEWAQRHLERLRRGSKSEMDDHPSTKRAPIKDDWVTAGEAAPTKKPTPPNTIADSEREGSWQGVGWERAPSGQAGAAAGAVGEPAGASDTSAPRATGKLEDSTLVEEPEQPRNRTLLFVGGGCLLIAACLCVTAVIGAVLFGDVGQEIARDIIDEQMGEFGIDPSPESPIDEQLPTPAISDEETPAPTTDATAAATVTATISAPDITFDDGLETTLVEAIEQGETGGATLEAEEVAHNWLFSVEEGEQFTISVTALDSPELDPQIAVYGEDGTLLAFDDDGGDGLNSRVMINVQPGQALTLRVTAFSGMGDYTITVEAGS